MNRERNARDEGREREREISSVASRPVADGRASVRLLANQRVHDEHGPTNRGLSAPSVKQLARGDRHQTEAGRRGCCVYLSPVPLGGASVLHLISRRAGGRARARHQGLLSAIRPPVGSEGEMVSKVRLHAAVLLASKARACRGGGRGGRGAVRLLAGRPLSSGWVGRDSDCSLVSWNGTGSLWRRERLAAGRLKIGGPPSGSLEGRRRERGHRGAARF